MDTDTLTVDAEESAMRELGIETDQAQGREPTPAAETPKERPVDPDVAPQPDAPASEPESPQPDQPELPESPEPKRDHPQQRPRDPVTGKFEKDNGQRPDTEYSRAQKEAARKERSWQALQAEKEQFRAQQTQWEEQQRMAQLEAARQRYQPLKKEGLTAQEYAEGAKRFEQEGDYENAYKAHQIALQLGQAEQQRHGQFQAMNAEYEWRKQMQELGTQYPQIFQEPIAGHLQRIIAQNPKLYEMPNGFRLAAEGAHLLAQNQELKEKDDEIIRLKAELEKGQRKSQPARGGFASPRMGEKDFDEMSVEEMEQHLKGVTAEADGYR